MYGKLNKTIITINTSMVRYKIENTFKLYINSNVKSYARKNVEFYASPSSLSELLSTGYSEVFEEEEDNDLPIIDVSVEKKKPKKKSKKEKLLINDDISSSFKSFEQGRMEYKSRPQFRSINMRESLYLKAKKTAKKTRLKKKFLSIGILLKEISNIQVPPSFFNVINKSQMELINLNEEEQRMILNLLTKLTKHELAIMLLLIAKSKEELKFLKEIFLSKQYIDTLFNNLSYKLL